MHLQAHTRGIQGYVSLSVSSMFPVWQVCQTKASSNGSSSAEPLKHLSSDWWMDMNVNLQKTCELTLASPQRVVLTKYQGMEYIVDLESMTQVNLKSGAIRRIRRIALSESP